MPDYSVQRFRGGFAIVYRDERGKRVRTKLESTDRPSAEAEARQGWEGRGNSTWTVGRIMTAYIADRQAEEIASTDRQRDAWKAMKTFWENVTPDLIDREMAQDYAKQRGVGPATIRYELSMLSVALRWAAAEVRKYISSAPVIWRPQPPERKTRHLSRAEFEKWFKHVKAPHARLYVELGLATMARPGAILDLQWPQVDWARAMIDLNPLGRRQTRKKRPPVPLNDDVMAALREAFDGHQSAYIIERGAEKIASIKKAFQAASERSGIKATPYTLRHTGAVWAAEAGVPMPELAQFMGHDDDRTTTKHYARFSPEYLRRVSDALRR